ncbi:hypothetical protein ATANTOWER_004745 [Ataeniobius toweri]|uniref:Uncharacterized protein n=1 Tax=Ataeniobius toweri TaxID=208326 RepID=A0ABU7A5A9_9TELE|nr:hypothetical protein [Ataeniobius toweri]
MYCHGKGDAFVKLNGLKTVELWDCAIEGHRQVGCKVKSLQCLQYFQQKQVNTSFQAGLFLKMVVHVYTATWGGSRLFKLLFIFFPKKRGVPGRKIKFKRRKYSISMKRAYTCTRRSGITEDLYPYISKCK